MALHLSTPEAEKKMTSSPANDLAWVSEPGADPQPAANGTEFAIHDPEGGQGVQGGDKYLMGADEFHDLFRGLVEAPNAALEMKGVEPLVSLPLAAQSPGCRKASDALYKTCRDVSWLNFFLEPEAEWLQRAMPVGFFVYGTYKAVRLELNDRAKNSAPDPAHQKEESGKPAPAPVADAPGRDQGVPTANVKQKKGANDA